MKRIGLSVGTGSFVSVADVIPKRLSRVDLVNQVTISGNDVRLRCYGAEQNDTILWKRYSDYKNVSSFDTLGTWHPIRGGATHDKYFFFAGHWSDTLYIRRAVAADAGMYSCSTEEDPESYGNVTILSMYVIIGVSRVYAL